MSKKRYCPEAIICKLCETNVLLPRQVGSLLGTDYIE